MRTRLAAGVLLCGLLPLHGLRAEGVDPKLMGEVVAVRVEIARSQAALRQYTWTEHMEVSMKGDVKQTTTCSCRYDRAGQVIRTPIDEKSEAAGNAVSKRHKTRKRADQQDYIERAITMIRNYVPPNPEQISALLQRGNASLGQAQGGKSEVRFTYYFQQGDSLVFTYDSTSKILQRVNVASTIGTGKDKDPVTLEATFEPLPDGVNHLSSAKLEANKKKVVVTLRNVMYQKTAE